jgi:hypothetical protein
MKKILFGVLALGFMVIAVSCGSSRKLAVTPAPAGMTEEVMPLSGPAYRSDTEYFRAVQSGVSTERGMAQKIGLQNCRQELATNIEAEVRLVIENYARNEQTPVAPEYETEYQEMAYTVVRQQLRDVQIVEDKLYRESNGTYRYYVCLQMSKAALADALEDAAAKKARAKLQFDRERFRKVYDEQMTVSSN